MDDYRIGTGFDVHRFAEKKEGDLILGGIVIDSPYSLEAVSDGDVVLHAVCDALCGAAGLGDIGDMFPPEDKASAGISSLQIVKAVQEKVKDKYVMVNMDITIIAEKPRLSGQKEAMTGSLQNIFSANEVNIKIKSKEGLNILGGSEAIACMATVLLKKRG